MSGVDESFSKSLRQLTDISKILIISVPFLLEEGMEAVVEIVIPLGIETISSFFRWVDDPDIIEIAFCDEHRHIERYRPRRTGTTVFRPGFC